MAKYAFRKLVPTVLGIGILIPTTYFAHDGYIKSTAQSNFEITANRLGFIGYKKTGKAISAQEHQEALLNQTTNRRLFATDKSMESYCWFRSKRSCNCF